MLPNIHPLLLTSTIPPTSLPKAFLSHVLPPFTPSPSCFQFLYTKSLNTILVPFSSSSILPRYLPSVLLSFHPWGLPSFFPFSLIPPLYTSSFSFFLLVLWYCLHSFLISFLPSLTPPNLSFTLSLFPALLSSHDPVSFNPPLLLSTLHPYLPSILSLLSHPLLHRTPPSPPFLNQVRFKIVYCLLSHPIVVTQWHLNKENCTSRLAGGKKTGLNNLR